MPCDFSHVWTPVENHCTWSLMVSYSCSIFSWGKRPLLYDFFLYFQECLAHIVHDSSKTGLINGWEVLTGPTVYASKTMELLFIFVVFDQSSPPASPNYRKNSVRSRKLVLWIHISFVGQWSSCMRHNFCWHIACSLFLSFFSCQKKTISIQVTSGKGWWWFLCDLGQVISTLSAAVSSSTSFPAPVFSDSMALCLLNSSHISFNRFVYTTKGRTP